MSSRRKKGHKVRIALMVTAIIAVSAVSATLYMRSRVTEAFAGDDENAVESEAVTTGSLTSYVSGSGSLSQDGVTDITIPSGVEIGKIFYDQGDGVEEGDLLFSVDTSSVLSAMSDVQGQLDTLDESLEEAASDAVSSSLTSGISGRVKEIYVQEDDDIATVMYNNNALIILSIDGYMEVDVNTDLLAEGDTVTVTSSDGTQYTGSVSSATGGVASILITDDGPENGDAVTVSFEIGTTLSQEGETESETVTLTGTLTIHSPLSITGYAGTVSSVDVYENESISADTSLLTLTNTSYSANYNTILNSRKTLEEELQKLIKLYQEGGVYAEFDGVIDTISDAYTDYVVVSLEDNDDISVSSAKNDNPENTAAQNTVENKSSPETETSDVATSAESSDVTTSAESSDVTTSAESSDVTTSAESSYMTASAETSVASTMTAVDSSASNSESDITVLTLDPGKQMTISISVDETDILSLEVGQSASVTIDSIGDDVYEGTVTEIDTSASSSSGVSTYIATVTIDQDDQMLSGMSASVSITINGIENALLVPAEAVHETSSSAYVYTSYNEETGEYSGMVQVTTGMTNGTWTEITSGLEEGDVVYYEENDSMNQSSFPSMGGNTGGFSFGGSSSGSNGSSPGSSAEFSNEGSRSGSNSGNGSPNSPSGGGAPTGSGSSSQSGNSSNGNTRSSSSGNGSAPG